MLWFTKGERVALAVLGACALAGLGLLLFQRRRPPLRVTGSATLVQVAHWDDGLRAAREVDVNTATVAELERLPEVGPALAHRIVDYRATHGRFQSTEDLLQVPGIGPTTYHTLKAYVNVENNTRD